ncbi:MAG: hypothetical protein A4E47_00599 [Methanosaeta sp. PtaU1.Bin028]|nr:MAG: hypothetical protein A4E47_00599 [Methanosaeta sp. PtaU1.Bin028]
MSQLHLVSGPDLQLSIVEDLAARFACCESVLFYADDLPACAAAVDRLVSVAFSSGSVLERYSIGTSRQKEESFSSLFIRISLETSLRAIVSVEKVPAFSSLFIGISLETALQMGSDQIKLSYWSFFLRWSLRQHAGLKAVFKPWRKSKKRAGKQDTSGRCSHPTLPAPAAGSPASPRRPWRPRIAADRSPGRSSGAASQEASCSSRRRGMPGSSD